MKRTKLGRFTRSYNPIAKRRVKVERAPIKREDKGRKAGWYERALDERGQEVVKPKGTVVRQLPKPMIATPSKPISYATVLRASAVLSNLNPARRKLAIERVLRVVDAINLRRQKEQQDQEPAVEVALKQEIARWKRRQGKRR